jgi:hypothetical protein
LGSATIGGPDESTGRRIMKRYDIQGPFHRRGKKPYWVVMDTIQKRMVSTHHRKADAYSNAHQLELKDKAR